MNSNTILEGIVSIQSAIFSKKRKVQKVLVDLKKYKERDRKTTHFVSFLKQNNIEYELCERDYIDKIALENKISGNTHGGFLAFCSERQYMPLDEHLEMLKNEGGYSIYLDGIEDPYNFGYCIRNSFALGAKGFIVPQRNWMQSAGSVARSSAGASELCEMTQSTDDNETLIKIKESGVKIVCAALSGDSIPLYDFNPDFPFILFIGGEKRGISSVFYENADIVVHIPYSNDNAKYSLPAASCAAIFSSHLSNITKHPLD